MARPVKQLSAKDVRRCGRIRLNRTEMAVVLGVSIPTLYQRFKDDPGLVDAYQQGFEESTAKLKKRAWSMALKGDGPMIRFLLDRCSDIQPETPSEDDSKVLEGEAIRSIVQSYIPGAKTSKQLERSFDDRY